MRWQERQKEWEIVVSLQKARIVELEEALRDLRDETGALAVALADGFRNMGNDGSGDDVSHPANWSLGAWVVYAMEVTKLYAHPADAPPSTNSGEVVNELVVGINEPILH